jgi:hypothetical protein
MPKEKIIDSVAELKFLQECQAAQKIQFEKEQREAKARVEEMYKIQHVLNVLMSDWRTKFTNIMQIKKLIAAFTADAAGLRQGLHEELIRGHSVEYRFGLKQTLHDISHTDGAIVECRHSIDILQAEMVKIFEEGNEYASKNHLETLLVGFKDPDD